MPVSEHGFEESMLRNLNLEDPPLPPKPWECISSENGPGLSVSSSNCDSSSRERLYDLSSVSEASLVRLVLNALQGVQSAVVSIEQFSALFCADPADRSGHRIPNLWCRSLSTCALGKMLKSFAFSGSLVILLHKFVEYFTSSSLDGTLNVVWQSKDVHAGEYSTDGETMKHPFHSIVNQAFAVAVRKVLEGYLCALDTLSASVNLRRFNSVSKASEQVCLTSISHCEVTLLEIYAHTKGLRTQIEALGHLCNLCDSVSCYSQISFEDLVAKSATEICNFYRGGILLTYLYRQLQIVDPAHSTLVKFLFLQSLEPYCEFIRSWIYEAKISDPYGEFVIECASNSPPQLHGKTANVDFSMATIRDQDGVVLPCFLSNVSVQLLRAGQQLQVVMKLLRLCNYVHTGEDTFEDILPSSTNFSSHKASGYPLSFNKGEVEAIVLSRKEFYHKMHEKLEDFMDTLDIKYRQVILHDAAYFDASYNAENKDFQYSSTLDEVFVLLLAADESNSNEAAQSVDSEASSTDENFSSAVDPLESSEHLSTDSSDEQVDEALSTELNDSLALLRKKFLDSLDFSGLSSDKTMNDSTEVKQISPMQNNSVDFLDKDLISEKGTSCGETVEHFQSWISRISYPGDVPHLGWHVGDLHQNPLSSKKSLSCDKSPNNGIDQWISIPGVQLFEEDALYSMNQSTPESILLDNSPEGHDFFSTNSFIIQSCNADPTNVFSVNPMLTKNAFLHDVEIGSRNTSINNKNFPCFDFSSDINPLEVCELRSSTDQGHHAGNNVVSFTEPGTSTAFKLNGGNRTKNATSCIQSDKEKLDHGSTLLNFKNNINDDLKNARGRTNQSLLSAFSSDGATPRHCKPGTEADFDMPLDFIIDKCLLQEILLQYNYVSRFCIKLLEGGFDLQGHFHALRRYHFMEIADWADLFITSLWHHKWYFTEIDQKVPEIQGLLESSIQRSSCERDHNKDRLFVFVKDQSRSHFSTEAIGLHSFDFIGLGYRVDWPVSIVLTPSALSTYAEIFTFLLQLKLAVLSLADVWCSLKDLKHLASKTNFNYLMKLRHQVNHFVSTLQQYVLSQLSDVSWCKFCNSLRHEVKDMMDLESVHVAYLADSLRICFLSEEMLPISKNLDCILQCAVDFRSCLIKGVLDTGTNQDMMDISQINILQARMIKEIFDKNINELHLSYLKSSKHVEFGLPCFWSCLDYNEYYSDAFSNDMRHYNLYLQ